MPNYNCKPMIDLVGRQFGRLTAIAYVAGGKWECQCSCAAATKTIVFTNNLTRGHTTSCGCYVVDRARLPRTHGKSRIPEYQVWNSMITRCTRPNSARYHCYGARGIAVCDRWLRSFADFIADMGRRPSKLHSIDRIDNDGPYSPENCRWATRLEQANNKNQNTYLTIGNVRMSIADWSRRTGLSPSLISGRIARGWPVEDIVTIGPRAVRKWRRRPADVQMQHILEAM